ncbi:proline-specific peptidase [Coprinellus micaceus]|uniref:Proline-specific peptidase n=1 Tax=Coprinellus micaceus TaxID=71717 RepID=A0A4Y7TH01_COPMI|nr:proline-specific peptidase [Coprinellus micaceus]
MPPECKVIDGYINFEVGSISKACKTYYKIIGTPESWGQPGFLILYDQVGGGLSTHLPEKNGDTGFWTIQLFLDELDNLLTKLKIEEYDLLGHSWGGALAVSHAVRRPPGLRNLILFSCDPSTQLLEQCQDVELKPRFPKEVREALEKYDEDGEVTPEYRKAREYYNKHHQCTIDPAPDAVVRAFQWVAEDPTVPLTLYGPNSFKTTGPMKDWTVVDDLHNIVVPTLVINGAQDSIVDSSLTPFIERIPEVKWVKFQHSSHMAHYEERDKFMHTIREFLCGRRS